MNRPRTVTSTARRTSGWRSCCVSALTWMLLTLALTSCATGTATYKAPVLPPPPPPPAVPATLRQVPPDLPLASDGRLPTLLRNQEQVVQACQECRSAQASLVKAVAEFERTAWEWYCQALAAIDAKASDCPPGKRADPDG